MFQFVNIDKTKNLIDIRLKNNFNQFTFHTHMENLGYFNIGLVLCWELGIKYIKIDNENIENNVIKKDIIDLNQKKNITWGENENINFQIIEEESDDDNIFKKLKKITPQSDDLSNNNINNNVTNRLNILEDKLEALNAKMDLIINLLSQ